MPEPEHESLADPKPGVAVRREPFSDNPQVGARGQRTQQLILDAALRVFGTEGYHQCRIDAITTLAGCSRASFYQYFSSKEDVFRYLAGQVDRQLAASIEMLGPLTADTDGWEAMRAWIGRYADVYERYMPVFRVFQAAAGSDEALASGSIRASDRHVASFRSRLPATLPPRQLDPVLELLLGCVPRTLDITLILQAASPDSYPAERVQDALADLLHRTFFGLMPAVNVHHAAMSIPALEFSPAMWAAIENEQAPPELNAAGQRTLQALLRAGRDVFIARGYHRTRIDDVVAATGVSHGAFYRYFSSKHQFAHTLAVRAIRTVSKALSEIPSGSASRAVLRNWLRRYNTTQAAEMAMIRVWVDATDGHPELNTDSAAAYDWGRRRLERFLRPRDFGDITTEAVALTALFSSFGARQRPSTAIDGAVLIIERGFLGR